jgi:hypothetical protein
MDTHQRWGKLLEKILLEYVDILRPYGDVKTYLIVSQDYSHFLLMHEGWNDQKRVHGMIVHAEIRDGKIWIHYDGTEDGITEELVAAGVPKDHIVLAFHPPHVRPHTGYATA